MIRPHPIPSCEAGAGGGPAVVKAFPDQAAAVIRAGIAFYSRPGVAMADMISERWLARSESPLIPEVRAVAGLLGARGAWLMNASYEWACTSAAVPSPTGGMRLLRVLDWRIGGLGRSLVAARRTSPAGPWLDITWPGLCGSYTGVAPGRFAAAINQAPLRLGRGGGAGAWLGDRVAVWRSNALPPAHALRLALDRCADFQAAVAYLSDVPLCLPVLFTLAGPEPGQAVVIEREERSVRIPPGATCTANDWQVPAGRARGRGIPGRLAAMAATAAADDWGRWLVPPVLNRDTRIVAEMDVRTGRTLAQGWEADGPATLATELSV